MKEEIQRKDDGGSKVKERGVNNNSLYDSFVEYERRAGKVKEERSRSLEGDGLGCLRTRSTQEPRSGNMGPPSRSPSRSGSPGGGGSDNRFYSIVLTFSELLCCIQSVGLVLVSRHPSQRVAPQIQARRDILGRIEAGNSSSPMSYLFKFTIFGPGQGQEDQEALFRVEAGPIQDHQR